MLTGKQKMEGEAALGKRHVAAIVICLLRQA